MSVNPLASTLAALLESAASAALALDQEAQERIATLDGQTLLLTLEVLPGTAPLSLQLTCRRTPGGGALSVMAESPHSRKTPHAIVQGRAIDVVASLWRERLPAGISIQGDERLLSELQRCFRDITPNVREHIERLLGGFSAGQAQPGASLLQDLLGGAELAFDTLRSGLDGMFNEGGERARDAGTAYWANEEDAEGFAARLEALQLNVDRLHAQVDHLTAQKSPQPTDDRS